MKINEVEQIVGITKKNIRFYEEQGLITPRRNAENGYREYGQEDVQTLRRIKLLRKLGVSMEEIRQMRSGSHTVADGMRRHMITLERESRNLEQSMALCRQMQSLEVPLDRLEPEEILEQMEQMERSGAAFRDRQVQDVRIRYVAPVVVTVLMVALMGALTALVLWTWLQEPQEAPPVWFILVFVGIFAAVTGGVVLALYQRIREIGKGEIDDARYY